MDVAFRFNTGVRLDGKKSTNLHQLIMSDDLRENSKTQNPLKQVLIYVC